MAFRQTVRYSVVSGICLGLGTTLIPLLSWWGLHYALATLVAFFLNVIVGFFLHSYWTFDVERNYCSLVRYISTVALNLPLTVIIIGISHDIMGLSVAASTVISASVLLIWNFIAVRWAVYRRM